MAPTEQLTTQGYDLQFGTNVLGKSTYYKRSTSRCALKVTLLYFFLRLGHFYFTKLLLPTLLATAKISPDVKVRIVNTSSMAHVQCSGIDFNTFKEGPARKKKGTGWLYSQSKLVRFLFQPYSNIHVMIGKYPCIK